MRIVDDRILLSATDLMRFAGCVHATALDLSWLQGQGPAPREDPDDARLLQKQGDAHEAAHLDRLKSEGRYVVEIERGISHATLKQRVRRLPEGPMWFSRGRFFPETGVAGRTFWNGSRPLPGWGLQL